MTVHDHSTRPSDSEATWMPPVAAPATAKPGRSRAKLAIAGAIVAAAAAGAGVTAGIMAGDGGTSTTAAAGGPGAAGQAGGAPGGGQGFGAQQGGPGGVAAGGTMAALHGTSVVSDGNGGYTTELTQTGTVSAVSATSITVKSTDGYTKTYGVGSATSVDSGSDAIGDVVAGHTVRVVATSANDQATATQIQDTDLANPGN